MITIKDIQKKVRITDEEAQGVIDNADVPHLMKVESAKLAMEIIDPPIINGTHFLDMVGRDFRLRFERYFNGGGKLVALKEGNKIIRYLTTNTANQQRGSLEGFVKCKQRVVKERIIDSIVGKLTFHKKKSVKKNKQKKGKPDKPPKDKPDKDK